MRAPQANICRDLFPDVLIEPEKALVRQGFYPMADSPRFREDLVARGTRSLFIRIFNSIRPVTVWEIGAAIRAKPH
jgi:hypothetical protein